MQAFAQRPTPNAQRPTPNMLYLFAPLDPASVAIAGEAARFPVHRIYCVGRNYLDHVREMGNDPAKEPPVFFMKPADAIVANGVDIPYASRTKNLHYEIELVVAIGKRGRNIDAAHALEHVYGYAVGNDYTRRDLQSVAREAGRPWDVAKGFDYSAAISAIHPATRVGHLERGRIWLSVNGVKRQEADLADMISKVPAVIAELSTFFELCAGDLIYMGTPAGVGPVKVGDVITGGVDGLDTLENRIVDDQ
jgi:fumarylpyruvate hydrolase